MKTLTAAEEKKLADTRRDAKDCLAFGRRAVYDRHPFFIATLYNLRWVEDESVGTMAVDDGNRLFYAPSFTSQHGRSYAGTFLAHEVGHIIRDHAGRLKDARPWLEPIYRKAREVLLSRYGIASLHDLWNWAGDLEINDDVERQGWKFPKTFQAVTPKNLGFKERLSAEKYAVMLCEAATAAPQKQPQQVFASPVPGAGGKCGGCAGNAYDWERKEDGKPKKADEAEKQILRKATANAIQSHIKTHGIGSVPGSWATWAQQMLEPPKIDWRKRLPSAIRHAMNDAAGAVDYKFGRPSRRAQGDFYLPSLRKPKVNVGVAIDTSGSMMGERTKKAAAELMGIAKAVGGKVEAFSVDAAVQQFKTVASAADLGSLLKGGGGTDMRVAIKEGAKRKYDVLVVLTDAESPWPTPEEMPRRTRVIVCVVGNYKVPAGLATVIYVDE